jgi:ABC-2 type transport system permease protein
MITAITAKELRSLFYSPLAWVILGVIQFILAWSFFTSVDVFFKVQPDLAKMTNAPGVTDMVISPLYEFTAVVLLIVMPLLTMRVLSEEKRSKTLCLLISAPVSLTEIIIGKYLALLTFILIMLAMVTLMPLSLAMGTSLDYAKLFSGLLGLFLLLSAFASAGIYMSSLTQNPVVAAITSFGLLILLWMINLGSGSAQGADSSALFSYLSLKTHFNFLLRGIFNTRDIAYFLLFIFTFIVLTIRQMETQRTQP